MNGNDLAGAAASAIGTLLFLGVAAGLAVGGLVATALCFWLL